MHPPHLNVVFLYFSSSSKMIINFAISKTVSPSHLLTIANTYFWQEVHLVGLSLDAAFKLESWELPWQ